MKALNVTKQGNTYPAKPELVKYSLYGETLLWDPNSMQLTSVTDLPKEEVKELLKVKPAHLCVPWKPQFQGFGVSPKARMLCLEVTHQCNLRCRYCFVGEQYEGGLGGEVMTIETAQRAIRTLADDQTGSIGFFGGEPLVNWDLMVQVVEFCKQHFATPRSHGVTTNATLMTKERAEYLDKHRFSIIVSIDGDMVQHNRNRPYAGGEGSFAATISGIEDLSQFNIGKRITFRGTYDAKGDYNILQALRFVQEKYLDKGVGHNYDIEPACLSESCAGRLGFEVKDVIKYKELYHEVAEYYIARAKQGKITHFFPFNIRLGRFIERQPACSECGAGNGYMSVNGAGGIFACHREYPTQIGDLDNGIDQELRAQWVDNRIYHRTTCKKCPLRYVCGGGCRANSVLLTGDIHIPDPVSCAFQHLINKEVMWILSQLGGEQCKNLVRQTVGLKSEQRMRQQKRPPQPRSGGPLKVNGRPQAYVNQECQGCQEKKDGDHCKTPS